MLIALLGQLSGRRCAFVYELRVKPGSAKLDKVPVNAHGFDIDHTNPSNWMAGEEAYALAASMPPGPTGHPRGVGISLSESLGIGCIDLDNCAILDSAGNVIGWTPFALSIVALLPGAAVEISQSGRGLHVLFTYVPALVPPHRTRRKDLAGLECYSRDRFMALTGTGLSGDLRTDHTAALLAIVAQYLAEPVGARDAEWTDTPYEGWRGGGTDEQIISGMLNRRTVASAFGGAASFADLWHANADSLSHHFPDSTGNNAYDRSAADQALANHLAWATGYDCERTLRIMQQSELRRDKWERDDYLPRTIMRAIAGRREAAEAKARTTVAGVPAGTSAAVANTTAEEPSSTERDPRTVILLRGGEFDRYTVQAEELLAGSIYVHGHGLVRIGRAAEVSNDAATITKREAAQAVCIAVSAGWLRRALMERAQFWKFDKRAREWERRDCPREIAENISDQEAWATFRPLVAISPVPVLRPDMSVWAQPGYDTVTSVYHHPTMTMPQIPPAPTRDDALQALARLRAPFNEFPYASPEGEAVFVAHVLTAVLRPSFTTSPVFLYTSPVAATGKTLLADMPGIIAHGVTPAHSPYSQGEELRKVLFASLLAGDSALTLDNVPNGEIVRAPGLCNFATSATVGDRILGLSENRKVPNRCTVVMTGNNVVPAGDMSRRSIVCRLDANAESARGRKFRIGDLRGHVRGQRAQLIVDAITVVRAYAFAGRPEVAHPLESFEDWSRLVRDPLVWLGMADAVKSQDTETDDELAPLQEAFMVIATATQSTAGAFTAAQLSPVLCLQPGTRDVLVNAGCAEPGDARKLGDWLRANKGRVAAGWKLQRDEGKAHRSATRWRMRAA